MTLTLRALLIGFAALVFFFVIRKLKRSQMQVLDSMFWLLFSFFFRLFPNLLDYFIRSWSNFASFYRW